MHDNFGIYEVLPNVVKDLAACLQAGLLPGENNWLVLHAPRQRLLGESAWQRGLESPPVALDRRHRPRQIPKDRCPHLHPALQHLSVVQNMKEASKHRNQWPSI